VKIAIEYGSRHNGIISRYSDRDLLLIHNGCKNSSEERIKFQLLGYDVTVMSEKKAIHLAKSGSLFLKHVITEGKIINGEASIYNNVNSEWRPKKDYQDEIDSNIDILDLLQTLPENKFSLLFVNDLLITSIRNIAIRKFAADGVYVFAWEEIFKQLYSVGRINMNDIKILLFSRKLKNAYRNRMYYSVHFEFIYKLFEIAKKIINFNGKINFCNRKSIVLGLPDKLPERSYKQLRAYEIVCSFYQYNSDVRNLASMVSKPSYFSSGGIGNDCG
jgi:hypothetical protein